MVLDCPHCGSERMGFAFGGEMEVPQVARTWNTLFMCRKCREGVVVKLHRGETKHPSLCTGDPRDEKFEVTAIYPKRQPGVAPFEKDDAKQMHWFTELFLMYVYSLPARVAKYGAPVKGDGQADA